MIKKMLMIVFCVFALGTLAACNFDDPVEHNDKVVAIIDQATKAYSDYADYATETDLEELDQIVSRHEETVTKEKEYLSQLDEIKPYNRNTTDLIDAGKAYVETNISVLENEEHQLLELWGKDESELSAEEYKAQQDEVLDVIKEKLDAADKKFDTEQAEFAKEHGYEVEE